MTIKSIYCCQCKENVNAKLVKGNVVYQNRPDLDCLNFYQCERCKNFVGCHKGTENPLGCIPTKEIKNARKFIHALIDPILQGGFIKRKKLYKLISENLGIKQYHTGWTRTIEECREVYKIGLKIKKEAK
ncbi:MAG: hypothetical protein KBT03_09750 [Bacteroidales bacterium]|nr:hypothetical protein [Candidatus Scybalousia scybalohippi]